MRGSTGLARSLLAARDRRSRCGSAAADAAERRATAGSRAAAGATLVRGEGRAWRGCGGMQVRTGGGRDGGGVQLARRPAGAAAWGGGRRGGGVLEGQAGPARDGASESRDAGAAHGPMPASPWLCCCWIGWSRAEDAVLVGCGRYGLGWRCSCFGRSASGLHTTIHQQNKSLHTTIHFTWLQVLVERKNRIRRKL